MSRRRTSRRHEVAEDPEQRRAAQRVGSLLVELGREHRSNQGVDSTSRSASLLLACRHCTAQFAEMTKLLEHRCAAAKENGALGHPVSGSQNGSQPRTHREAAIAGA